MRSSMHLLAALATLTLGCDEPATAPLTATTPPAPAVAPPPPAVESLPLPGAVRRERAGIDLADGSTGIVTKATKARVPAAEFIVTAPPSTAPEFTMGDRAAAARGALRWVRDTWAPAALSDDWGAYAALLRPDFKGRLPEQSDPIGAGDWAGARTPAVGTPVTWGPEEITATPDATGNVTIAIREAHASADGCVCGSRSLTLVPTKPDGDSGWKVRAEERSKVVACPVATGRDVSGVSEQLRIAWGSRDLSAVRAAVHGGFTLLDGGVEAARYNITELTSGPGRWVLDRLTSVEATAANTRVVGDRASVGGDGGDLFVFSHVGGTWRLTSLWRPWTTTR